MILPSPKHRTFDKPLVVVLVTNARKAWFQWECPHFLLLNVTALLFGFAGRGLLSADITVGGHPFTIATSHLESPCNGKTYHDERVSQMETALESLDAPPRSNVVFAGDTNWQRSDGSGGPSVPQGNVQLHRHSVSGSWQLPGSNVVAQSGGIVDLTVFLLGKLCSLRR